MTISLKHSKTSAVADGGDTDLVQPSDWNAEHTLTQAADRVLGRVTAGAGATEELTAAQVRTLINVEDGATADQSAAEILTAIKTVDGTGSLLDADLLDGNEASAFATAAQGALADSALQSSDIGVSVQAWDAQLDSLSSASADGVSLVTAANYAAMRGLLDLEAGTDFYSISAADAAFATAAQGTLADGAIQGPGSATDNAVVRFDSTTGKLAQNSDVIIDDSGNVSGVAQLTASVSSAFQGFTYTCTDAGASAGPVMSTFRDSASPAASDEIGRFVFNGRDSAGNSQTYGYIQGTIVDPTSTSEIGAFKFNTVASGSIAERMRVQAGIWHPSATGGDKGNNTINFGAVYDDNSLLTDYVFDKWLGVEQTYSPRVQEKADQLDPAMFSVEAHVTFMRESRRLYGMPDLDDCIDGIVKEKSLGEMVQLLWQSLELAHIHIAELHERLKVVENS